MECKPAISDHFINNVEINLIEKPVSVYKYLQLYNDVGRKWNWADRVIMDEEELKNIINSENNSLYTFHINGIEAGYVEFINYKKYVEIQYFGLFDEFTGKGYGKKLFKWCIDKAWSKEPEWIQLNTCDLDHGAALELYKKLGFTEYKTEIAERHIFS